MTHSHYYSFFQEQLQTHSSTIASSILELLEKHYPKEYSGLAENDQKDMLSFLEKVVTMIGNNIVEKEDSTQKATDLGENIGEAVAKRQGILSDYISKLSLYKEAIWTFVEGQMQGRNESFKELMDIVNRIDTLFNYMVHGFTLAFSKVEQRKLHDYEEKYLKLSTPIVPIMDHVAILPIIGEIDEKRANVIIEETLREANELDIDWLVIDLSGVYHVDDLFMSHLEKLLTSLEILGLKPVLTGMRPDLSMRAVQMGLVSKTKEDVITKATLKQAVAMLYDQTAQRS
ncbi:MULTISPECIES: STAS domain-containing protein [Pontibacillus]|uniref:STAS domain-containing protein n=1 Tax=Pontibacillus chungwhensis TaxID=265426 RepID=A0ABY8UXC3_9BACI|nr:MULTISPECIES: STAS domain-containing protein [Pontibacillus]MCD5323994.1 STAS domain-containing protein [Pontibacillus sp. HN14]WIF97943.1 STAS domain-containing protein [Pontibacillus chungwhensis]